MRFQDEIYFPGLFPKHEKNEHSLYNNTANRLPGSHIFSSRFQKIPVTALSVRLSLADRSVSKGCPNAWSAASGLSRERTNYCPPQKMPSVEIRRSVQ